MSVLKPVFSEEGSNKRKFENEVYSAFMKYLRKVAGKCFSIFVILSFQLGKLLWISLETSLNINLLCTSLIIIHTVGIKSMSPVDIELLFDILYNITTLHHNTNVFSTEIK